MLNQNVKSLDVNAKTVDEAIEQGLARLGLTRQQVDVEIIKEGKRGVFGLGAEDAQVRLTPRPTPPPAKPIAGPPAAKHTAPRQAPPPAPAAKTAPAPVVSQPEPDNPAEETSEVARIAKLHLSNLLKHMDIEGDITANIVAELVETDEEPPLVLNITGKDLGILIGRRSETMRALQYMLRLMVSKDMGSWQPVVVDVESYRIRRRRSLHRMAEKMAERAVASQKRVVLEAMPAFERRVIHVALKNHPAVITKSIGTDENRKVTIIPK